LVTRKDAGVEAMNPNGAGISLAFSSAGEIAQASGGEMDRGGWISPSFGVKTEAPVVRWRGVIPNDGLVTIVQVR
jgi:hypothetical protein